MSNKRIYMILRICITGILTISYIYIGLANAQNVTGKVHIINPHAQRVFDHWTPERREQAIPRDLVIDEFGQGFLRRPNGNLAPYGQNMSVAPNRDSSLPLAKPISGDTTPPVVSSFNPAAGGEIFTGDANLNTATYEFSVDVTDSESGVKSVTFDFFSEGTINSASSFSATQVSDKKWTVTLNISVGNWSWSVTAKDNGAKGGNETTTEVMLFTVSVGSGSGGGTTNPPPSTGSTVTNDPWNTTSADAIGRIYFELPRNAKRTNWIGYVCSGTAVNDGTDGRSIIITAAHCVYDDANKAFARNVLFIPDQDETTASGTDLNCSNDPIGCWAPSFGVVDKEWTVRTFPDNIAWDYAYYVVEDSGAHQAGLDASDDALDIATSPFDVSFVSPSHDADNSSADYTHALGYSYSYDPQLRYCAEDMTTEGPVNWWLPSCELSGGSSGGAWIQPMTNGSGPIISVNSWGYTTSSGMAGPFLDFSSASILFDNAKSTLFGDVVNSDGDAGVVVP